MLVEYSFVTTLEPNAAMRLASEFLVGRGFMVKGSNAFALDGGTAWNALEVHRGKRRGRARTKTAIDLPQFIRLEWERGRVNMAALSLFNSGVLRSSRGRLEGEQKQLLLAIIRSVEMVVGGQLDKGAEEWDRAEQQVVANAAAKLKSNRILIIVAIIAATIAVIIAILAIANSPHLNIE